jgi:hypothetical protein
LDLTMNTSGLPFPAAEQSRAPMSRRERRRLLGMREAEARGLRGSARDIFPILRGYLLDSCPVVGEYVLTDDPRGPRRKVYGKPTYRNVIIDGQLR